MPCHTEAFWSLLVGPQREKYVVRRWCVQIGHSVATQLPATSGNTASATSSQLPALPPAAHCFPRIAAVCLRILLAILGWLPYTPEAVRGQLAEVLDPQLLHLQMALGKALRHASGDIGLS